MATTYFWQDELAAGQTLVSRLDPKRLKKR